MKNKKVIKYSIISIVVLLILILIFLVYKNIFASSASHRYEDREKYKLTNNEINSVKDEFSEYENIDEIDIYVSKSNIITIFIKLKEDENFKSLKKTLNKSINNFKEENLTYYDLQVFIESANEESETYPQSGYKHKTNSEFSW